MAEEARRLIEHRGSIRAAEHPVFGRNIQVLLERSGVGLCSFAREVSHHHKSVACWMDGRQKPRLCAVAVVAFRFGLGYLDLLSGSVDGTATFGNRPLPEAAVASLKPTLHRHDPSALRRELEATLSANLFPPPSLVSVAKRLECHSSYLQRKFPDLPGQISAAHRQYWSIHKTMRIHFAKLVTKSKTSEMAARGEYPSQRKLTRALPSKYSLRMPEVKEAWLETLREWDLMPPQSGRRRESPATPPASMQPSEVPRRPTDTPGVLQAKNERPELTGR